METEKMLENGTPKQHPPCQKRLKKKIRCGGRVGHKKTLCRQSGKGCNILSISWGAASYVHPGSPTPGITNIVNN